MWDDIWDTITDVAETVAEVTGHGGVADAIDEFDDMIEDLIGEGED